MSNIDYTIRNWFREHITYIIAILFVFVMAICIYGQADRDIKKAVEQQNRINNIEKTIQNHTHYIDELVDDVDNLKEQEMLDIGKIKRPH